MAKVKGQIATKQEIATLFGVSLPTVEAWVRSGCPYVEKGGMGKSWQFDTAAVLVWQKDKAVEDATGGRDASIDELKKRETRAKTELSELELAKAKGEVAPIAEFEKVWAMAMGQLRQNIMNVPQRVVLTLLGETDETVFKQKLREELTLALEQTAESEFFEDENLDDE